MRRSPRFSRLRELLLLCVAVVMAILVWDATMGTAPKSAGALSADRAWAPGSSVHVGAAVGSTRATAPPATAPPSRPLTTTSAPSSTSTTIYTHAIGDPVRIVIPAIDVDALIVQVGVLEDGSMEVPSFGYAGWFRVGPAPGAPGPAVIVGHVDSKKGSDVFYHLKDLVPGEEVLVYDRNGDMAVFVIDSLETVLKSELPTERIWNQTPEPVLRLITCGGAFDSATGHYLSNVIVYGHLVK